MKLKLNKREICSETKKLILPLKHDRYLARVHTLVSTSISLIISLILFIIAGAMEDFFSIDSEIVFVFLILTAFTITTTLAVYIHWKNIRIKSVECLIDICESKS